MLHLNFKSLLVMVVLASLVSGCQREEKENQKVKKRGKSNNSSAQLKEEGGLSERGNTGRGKGRLVCATLDADGCLSLVKVNETFAKLDDNIAHLTTSGFQVYLPGTRHERTEEKSGQTKKSKEKPQRAEAPSSSKVHLLGKALEVNNILPPLIESGLTWKNLRNKYLFLRPVSQMGCQSVTFENEKGDLVSYKVISGVRKAEGIGEREEVHETEDNNDRTKKGKSRARARIRTMPRNMRSQPLVLKNEATNEVRVYQAQGCGYDASLKVQVIQPLQAPVCGIDKRELGVTYNVLIGDKAGARSTVPMNLNMIQLIRDHSDVNETFKRLTSQAKTEGKGKNRSRTESNRGGNRTIQVDINLAREALAHIAPRAKLKELTCPGQEE